MSLTRGRALAVLVMAMLGAGLFLAVDASRHTNSRYDGDLARAVQGWDAPGLSATLEFVNEFTNFYPSAAIWSAILAFLIWRRYRVEAFVLLISVVAFWGAEALGVLVNRPRPSPELVHVSKALIGNGFPSGHVFGAVIFYGLLTGVALRRVRWLPVRLLAPALGVSIVATAAVARVYLGAHWPSDVLGGFLLGSVTLAGLLWVYAGLSAGCIEFLGLEFRITSLGERTSGLSLEAAPIAS